MKEVVGQGGEGSGGGTKYMCHNSTALHWVEVHRGVIPGIPVKHKLAVRKSSQLPPLLLGSKIS